MQTIIKKMTEWSRREQDNSIKGFQAEKSFFADSNGELWVEVCALNVVVVLV
jgi:hypothetical protein